MFKRYSYTQYIFIFLFLILVSISQDVLSQSRYTVALPEINTTIPPRTDDVLAVAADASKKETAKSFFQFDLNHLPQFTQVKSYYLRMYIDTVTKPKEIVSFSTHPITALKMPSSWTGDAWTGNETSLNDPALRWANTDENKKIGRYQIQKGTDILNMKLNPKAFDTTFDIVSLAVRSPKEEKETLFYSSITAQNLRHFSKVPKLVLQYEITSPVFRSDWAQSFSTAQHDSYLNWSTNTTISKPLVRTLPTPPNRDAVSLVGADPTGAIAVFKNQPIIFTQTIAGNTLYEVKQLNASGDVLWSQGVDNIMVSRPLIDESGYLYHISLTTLTILDLNNSGAILYKKSLSEITNDLITSIQSDATLGYDGTLYFASDDGVVALSAYPQLNVRWKYDNENSNQRNGPVSLSQDEGKAFFINVDTNENGRGRLVMLDNTDGTVLDITATILKQYKSDKKKYYIPAPIFSKKKKKEAVFVLDGYDEGNQLFVFDVTSETLSDPVIITSKQEENIGISQPAIDGEGNVFFVFNEKIARYNTKEENLVSVFEDSPSVNSASILVTDKSSNIYVATVYKNLLESAFNKENTPEVLGFTYTAKGGFAHKFTAPITEDLRKSLVLAPDGTLYMITATNVIAVTAKEVANENIILSDLNTNTVYRATNTITLTGFKVFSTVNTILYSGGGMGLKPGFTVRKGASVTFKTGY